jgi:hypothetical protein
MEMEGRKDEPCGHLQVLKYGLGGGIGFDFVKSIFPTVQCSHSTFEMPLPSHYNNHLSRYCFRHGIYKERLINQNTSTSKSKATREMKQKESCAPQIKGFV